MACGVHLGILLVCLFQAEHARCLWVTEAQRPNSDRYVGFSQQDRGVRRFGGSSPQNQFRQASVSTGSARNSSFNTQIVVNSGFSQRFSSSGSMQTVSHPVPNEYASVGLKRNSSVSKLYRQQVNVQKMPKANLYNPIYSGSSINGYNKKQTRPSNSRKSSWPVEQGTGMSVQSLSSAKYLFKSAPQSTLSTAAKTPACSGQRGSSSRRLRSDASTEVQPLGCSLSRRVHGHRHSGAFKPSLSRKTPSQRKLDQNKPSAVKGGNVQGSYKPSSNVASSHVSYSQHPPDAPYRQNALVSFEPYSLETPSNQDGLCSASTSKDSGQASWNRNPAQGAHNLPARPLAPSRIHIIPQRFGGYAIRRLKSSADQRELCALKPQQTSTTPPQQPAPYKAQAQKVKWLKVKPRF